MVTMRQLAVSVAAVALVIARAGNILGWHSFTYHWGDELACESPGFKDGHPKKINRKAARRRLMFAPDAGQATSHRPRIGSG
jgi:hypothetical protein